MSMFNRGKSKKPAAPKVYNVYETRAGSWACSCGKSAGMTKQAAYHHRIKEHPRSVTGLPPDIQAWQDQQRRRMQEAARREREAAMMKQASEADDGLEAELFKAELSEAIRVAAYLAKRKTLEGVEAALVDKRQDALDDIEKYEEQEPGSFEEDEIKGLYGSREAYNVAIGIVRARLEEEDE